MSKYAPYIGTALTIAVPVILAVAAGLAKRTKTPVDDKAVSWITQQWRKIRHQK